MSKGLGKIEREILSVLKNARLKKNKGLIQGFSVIHLARIVYGTSYLRLRPVTRSQYTSVCRAVENLRKKDYVITKFLKIGDEGFYNSSIDRDRSATRLKFVKPGSRMYEEEEWLKWYKRFDMKKEELPDWYKKQKR